MTTSSQNRAANSSNKPQPADTWCYSCQITIDELSLAPANVRRVLEDIPSDAIVEVPVEPETLELAQTYISRGALSQKWFGDAVHVAAATLSGVDLSSAGILNIL